MGLGEFESGPTNRVLAYIRDMCEWERTCRRDARRQLGEHARVPDVKEFCLARRNKVLLEHCDCDPSEFGLSMGVPPTYSDRGYRIAHSRVYDDRGKPEAEVVIVYDDANDKMRFGRQYRFSLRYGSEMWKILKVEMKLLTEDNFDEIPIG